MADTQDSQVAAQAEKLKDLNIDDKKDTTPGAQNDQDIQDSDDDNPLSAPTPLGMVPDASNFAVKHPLQNSWTLWYDNPGKRTNPNSWADHLKKITTFDTVEDFWCMFNHLKPASALMPGSNYHLFKSGIEPKWEDAANSRGGKWTITVPSGKNKMSLDQIWLYAVLACIGETLDCPDEVCGIVVSARRAGDRVQLWSKDAANEHNTRAVGRSLKQAVEFPDNLMLAYLPHTDSMSSSSKKGSYSKNKYEV